MNSQRNGSLLGLLVAATLLLSACGGSAAPAAPQPGALAPANRTPGAPVGGEAPGAGEAAGGEAALVPYRDTTQHFSVAHPANWSQDPAALTGVKFQGADGTLDLHFVPRPNGPLAAYAQQDAAALSPAYPGFKAAGIAPSPDIPNVLIQGFTATGQSAVTGKPFVVRGERYYMPLADGRLAVLTVVGPAPNFDPQGVRDIALTLKATP